METQKGPYKDYSPSKRVLYGFPCQFGGVYVVIAPRSEWLIMLNECSEGPKGSTEGYLLVRKPMNTS